MKELGVKHYKDNEYRELFNIMIDSHICEDTAIGITNDGVLLYAENKLMNNSSAYWMQSVYYTINKDEFRTFLNQARSKGNIEEAIKPAKKSQLLFLSRFLHFTASQTGRHSRPRRCMPLFYEYTSLTLA